MKKILECIKTELEPAFEACGYDCSYAKAVLSNRPDLCEYQCNGAMAAAKAYKKKPIEIAGQVVEKLAGSPMFSLAEAVMPGFINLRLSETWLADYLTGMRREKKLGVEEVRDGGTIIVDYGGANVAKPLHVGHLRSAIIGESIKRMGRFLGYHMIGDVHLGDWGLQMGLIIEELRSRHRRSVQGPGPGGHLPAAERICAVPRPVAPHYERVPGGPEKELRQPGRLL